MLPEPIERLMAEVRAACRPLADVREALNRFWGVWSDLNEDLAVQGWFGYERPIADRLARPGARVLVVGAGSGRELVPLAEAGCEVTGMDPSPHALTRARGRLAAAGVRASLCEGYADDRLPEGTFDLIWFSWFTYGYIPWSRRRIAMLRMVERQLAPDGHVVVSVMPGPFRSRVTDAARAISGLWPNDWRFERGDVLSPPDSGQSPFIHRFAPGELDEELRQAGFRVDSRHDDGDLVVAVRA